MFKRRPDPAAEQGLVAVQAIAAALQELAATMERMEAKLDTVYQAYKEINQ